jgi:hypothetical protein
VNNALALLCYAELGRQSPYKVGTITPQTPTWGSLHMYILSNNSLTTLYSTVLAYHETSGLVEKIASMQAFNFPRYGIALQGITPTHG